MTLANYTQNDAHIAIRTSFGNDAFLLQSFVAREAISQPFSIQCRLLAQDLETDPAKLLRQAVAISCDGPDGATRYFHGIVRQASSQDRGLKFDVIDIEVVPRLWTLSLTTDSRIFQHKTVPQIVKKILRKYVGLPFRLQLTEKYPEREYCVQYQESDLNFISRLLEEEGIYYYFEHSDDQHVLVLADQSISSSPCPLQPRAVYFPHAGHRENQGVFSLGRVNRAVTQGIALADFDFQHPKKDLHVKSGPKKVNEKFVYQPGGYKNSAEGERIAHLRMEEEHAASIEIEGTGNCAGFNPGYHFDLELHDRPGWNQSYFITAVEHRAQTVYYNQTNVPTLFEGPQEYQNQFRLLPGDVPFRPRRITPKPVMQGTQTAIVTGRQNTEVDPDEFARVKIRFHWDRHGGRNESSSCWVRVSQPWAGGNWGAMSIPRVGQEMIVDFLDGDPDLPIITGRVYNGDQMPPYALPAGASRMGMKSQTLHGDGYNEMSIDDTAGSERIVIHAQHNMITTVGNDEMIAVTNNRVESVGVDEQVEIGNNRIETVGNNKSTTVTNAYNVECDTFMMNAGTSITLQCGASRIHMNQAGVITISGNIITTAAAVTATVAAPITSVTGAMVLTLAGSLSMHLGGISLVMGGSTIVQGGIVKINPL
ncbi:MAG: type VI secretion system Vgr family protein [Bryobacteraceae bacterium]